MKKSRFTEEQIAYALRQAEGGTPVTDVCRQLGVSVASFYVWKRKYAQLDMTEIRKLRQLEDENSRLKKVVAELTLDKHVLQEALRKKGLKPTRRKELAIWMHETYGLTIQKSCRLARLQRATWYYRSKAKDQSALRQQIREIAADRPRFGY